MRSRLVWSVLLLVLFCSSVTPANAENSIPRILPPRGIEISAADHEQLQKVLREFERELIEGRKKLHPEQLALLPDIELYHKAVRYALDLDEFYKPEQVAEALKQIETGRQRLKQLLDGKSPWTAAHGLVVRAYRSKIDGSVQPYGLLIPDKLDLQHPAPLYVWLHGRNDKGTDLSFVLEQEKSKGQIVPENAIVLRVFGRYCNSFKFAGEVDVFEALDSVKQRYKIDDQKIVLIGFSMGGAGCWHLAAHHPTAWIAASPGAGFVDTRRYQGLSGDKLPAWYEQKLWGYYDVPDYARNMFNYPVIAYSGELDKQKASADIMEEVFQSQGHKLERIIGPKVEHKYEPQALQNLMARLKQITESKPTEARTPFFFETRTLRYHMAPHEISVEGLAEHWIDSRLDGTYSDEKHLKLQTTNITRLRLQGWGHETKIPADATVDLDGDSLSLRSVGAAPIEFVRANGHWKLSVKEQESGLRKKPGLQGPIDDAFMEDFLVVTPSKKSPNAKIAAWVEAETKHFQDRWQRLYRGQVRLKPDSEVTAADIANSNLILWGDAQSNSQIAQIIDKLPIHWNEKSVQVGSQTFSSETNVPVLIYPNPLNPAKYVVLNSGITFREAHDQTNSQQTPKLPDWAVIDVTQPPDDKTPGKIVAADFFDESWSLKKK